MDIEVDVANISLQDKPIRTPSVLGNSSQNDRTQTTSTGSESDGDPATREKFMQLLTKARQLTENGDIALAIKLNEEALAIRFSDKLQRRIGKMKAFLAEQEKNDADVEDEGKMKSLGHGFMLHASLFGKLYTHQKEGVLWMWSLFRLGKGGILADDMGLGKTIQVIGFLAGLFDMNKIKSVMIVVPLSVLPNWLDEFNRWAPGINVMQFHGSSKKEKERALARVRTRGGVLMTTYGLVITTKETFAERHGQQFVWDYVILDEGHKIKNPTKTSKSIHLIPAKHRLILTGTPVQNNLKELWSLFDYVHQGSLLGTVRTFKMEFENPIIRARERDTTAVEKKLGQEMAQTLKSIIQPYFLRRTKAEVSAGKASDTEDSKEQRMPNMTRKNDLVIWLHLTETQQQIYQDFLNLDQVKELLMTKKSPLVALTVLKKICDHPRLLSTRACLQLGLDGESFNEEDLEQPESYECAATQIHKIPDETLIQESGKMLILVDLLDTFKSEGHRTLVFSQSRKLLDIIQKVITNRGHKVARLDGTIGQTAERGKIVQRFQSDHSFTVFLLTIQVGGVGLTITSADRVIIYDPNWNPATDAQAVDRAYRIGQVKNVVVYRLITCGTVEEKIYRRQVFKDSITRQTTGGNKNPYRYFTKMELKELFTLDDPKFSKTQRQLQTMHGNQRESDTALDDHIAFLHSLDIFGISDHDLMFKQTSARDDEEDDVEVITGQEEERNDANFIEHKVRNAQKLIAEESTNCLTYEQRSKGAMRYPSSSSTTAAPGVPRPSPLFTNVEDTQHDESPDETSNEDMISQGSDKSSHEVIDLTEPDDEDSSPERVARVKHPKSSSRMTPISVPSSPIKQESDRKVLQPLTHKEIQQRSPCTPSTMTRAGEIVAEELLISPDTHSPIMSLTKIHGFHRSVRDISPVSTPAKLGVRSPKSHSKATSPHTGFRNASSPPSRKPQGSALKTLFQIGATSTPQSCNTSNILVEQTPNSVSKSSNASGSSVSFSPHTTSLDVSNTFRKLSFAVPESDQSMEESPCPVIRNKHKSQPSLCSDSQPTAHDNDESVTEAAGVDTSIMSASGSDERRVLLNDQSQIARSLQGDFNESASNSDRSPTSANKMLKRLSDMQGESDMKTGSNKRRSVCVQPRLEDDSFDDESLEKLQLTVDASSEEEAAKDESDEDDKENSVPVSSKSVRGRCRIVSESESEGGSCFEVEESEEEVKPSQGEDGETDRGVVSQEEDFSQLGADESHDDGEDDVADEEENERFQNLIAVARSLYKEKNFGQSLLYVEEALSIFYDSDLEDMANKIRKRVQAQ